MLIRASAKTDVGRVREHNEDSFLMQQGLRVFAVADGMGGHAGGAQASQLAVATLQEYLNEAGQLLVDDGLAEQRLQALNVDSLGATPIDVLKEEAQVPASSGEQEAHAALAQENATCGPPIEAVASVLCDAWDPGVMATSLAPVISRMLQDGVRRACRTIFDRAIEVPALMGMGTTLTVLCLHKNWAYVAHVGDSRCYMQRGDKLMQITEDHSFVNEQILAGLLTADEARTSRHKNIITRSVGFEPDVEVDTFLLPTRAGDQFLLCSDGLSNLVEDNELAEAMAEMQGGLLLQSLVDLALERGGDDNITAVAVEVLEERDAAQV